MIIFPMMQITTVTSRFVQGDALVVIACVATLIGFAGVAAALYKLYRIKQVNPKAMPTGLFYAALVSGALNFCGFLLWVIAKMYEMSPQTAIDMANGRMKSLAWLCFGGLFWGWYWWVHPEIHLSDWRD